MRKWMKVIVLVSLAVLIGSCSAEQTTEDSSSDETFGEIQQQQEDKSEETVTETVEVEVVSRDGYEGELFFLGRASVKIKMDDGLVIYIDPASGVKGAYDEPADLVLVTHQHLDHNMVESVTLKEDAVVLECPSDLRHGAIKFEKGIRIEAVEAYNENHRRAVSCGFVLTIGDIVIYHSGDTSTTDQMQEMKDMDIDYALLCSDGYYNMSVDEAEQVAELIQPEAVIPIHNKASGSFSLDAAEAFDYDDVAILEPGESLRIKDLDNILSFEEEVNDLIDMKLDYIENVDFDSYMDLISERNDFYYNEQERWFDEMVKLADVEFDLMVLETEMVDDETYIAYIKQKQYKPGFITLEYPLVYYYELGEWKDGGYYFDEVETDKFIVKYMEGEDKVEEFKVMMEQAFVNLEGLYGVVLDYQYEIKLFDHQELLRQRTIPSSPTTFVGWSEPDESIKIYTGFDDYQGYPGVVQHELVHHITINICNNNLPVWMLEGLAMYDGSAFYDHSHSGLLSTLTKDQVSLTIDEVENLDLHISPTTEEVYAFYNTSFMYFKFIAEEYGHDKIMAMFHEAGKKPFHESNFNPDFYRINKETASDVIRKVLGMTKAELSIEYLVWLEETDYFDNRVR